MKEIRAVFLATTPEAKEIFMPFFRKMVGREDCDVLVYNSGPVVQEIKDRNVVITVDRDKDADIIPQFKCGVICLGKDTDIDMGIKAIEREAEKGA